MAVRCFDVPSTVLRTNICLSAISKNAKGELGNPRAVQQKCAKPQCRTLKTVQTFKVEVSPNRPCDSPLAKALNGTFVVNRFVSAYEGGDGNRRGIHTGDFEWHGAAAVAKGRMSGVTNAGTHRQPVFDACQRCDAHGFMEGRFCGVVTEPRDPALKDCSVQGTYRFRFDPGASGGHGAIQGTFEGSIVCTCLEC